MKLLLKSIRDKIRNINPLLLSKYDKYYIKPTYSENIFGRFSDVEESKIIIFMSCRNNYNFLESIVLKFALTHYKSFAFVVIDDESEPEQILKFSYIASKYNIKHIKNNGKGIQDGLSTLIQVLEGKIEGKVIYFMTQDSYPVINFPDQKILELANKMLSENIDIVGFNTLDYRQTRPEILDFKKGLKVLGMLGRKTLSKGHGGWIRGRDVPNEYKATRYFQVEAPADMSALLRLDLIKKIWKPNENFWLYMWLDDIANTVLLNNGKIIVDSEFILYHCQELKRKYLIPVNSVDGSKNDGKFFRKYGPHLDEWKNKWGYCRLTKENLEIIPKKYKNTYIEMFYKRKGVLKAYNGTKK